MKIVGIIIARIESKRFPGKIMAEIDGKSILQHCIETSRDLKVDDLVVATGYPNKNEEIMDLCKKLRVKIFCADYVLRINADCPFYEPTMSDLLIDYAKTGGWEYITYWLKGDEKPIVALYPRGEYKEVISTKALYKTYFATMYDLDLQHVTPFIYNNEYMFGIKRIVIDKLTI